MANRTGFVDGLSEREVVNAENLIIDAQFLIQDALTKKRMTRADLAKAAGLKKSYLTAILGPNANPTLRTLAKVFTALDETLCLKCAEKRRDSAEVLRRSRLRWDVCVAEPGIKHSGGRVSRLIESDAMRVDAIYDHASNENGYVDLEGEELARAA